MTYLFTSNYLRIEYFNFKVNNDPDEVLHDDVTMQLPNANSF